ncbi:3-phosphoserine/phosphohydroxythreonine transaminase [Novimethylophilus kurashikiensis]|nr:3-phosphoserine/phosphohydroxythreonine transaminase [Novimethylophilus kurashikiensis]
MAQPFLAESRRVFNFAAGPGVMPEEVILQAQRELPDWDGQGFSLLETPFSGVKFKRLLGRTRDTLRELLKIPDHFHILFMHGGASAQFSLVPLNLLGDSKCAAYVDSGYWSRKAIHEAHRYCQVEHAAIAEDYIHTSTNTAYCHITSNETADGLQLSLALKASTPLIVDMTSDFLVRPIDFEPIGLIYAGAQKNIGPAGLTIVIVRDDLLGRAHALTPTVLNYTYQVEAGSLVNTPLTYSIYLANLVFQWIGHQGGITSMAKRSQTRSAMIYDVIDASEGFYRCDIPPDQRSRMNLCFKLPDEPLTQLFIDHAAWSGLVNLKGHVQKGGIRASLYNAMPDAGVVALADFMHRFRKQYADL